MKRFARHLFTIFSAVSLLMCVAVCALWVRSYWVNDELRVGWDYVQIPGRRTARGGFVMSAEVYRMAFARSDRGVLTASLSNPAGTRQGGDAPKLRWTSFPHKDSRPTREWFAVQGPTWPYRRLKQFPPNLRIETAHVVPAVITGVLPIYWLFRARGRSRAGHCRSCGYDLRASPERCPECGTAATEVTT